MFIVLIILLVIIGAFAYVVTVFPKQNVIYHAKRDGVGINVWAKAQSLRNKIKAVGTYYPLNIPTFTLAHLASVLTYFYSSKGIDESIIGGFVIPSDLNLLFNRNTSNNNRYYDPSQPPQKEEHNNVGVVAFLITTHSRLMFAHWNGKTFGASCGMYTLNPRQFSCQTNRGIFSTSLTINPNSNSDEDAWGICYFPWANVATKVASMLNSKLSQVNQTSVETDENGRSLM